MRIIELDVGRRDYNRTAGITIALLGFSVSVEITAFHLRTYPGKTVEVTFINYWTGRLWQRQSVALSRLVNRFWRRLPQ